MKTGEAISRKKTLVFNFNREKLRMFSILLSVSIIVLVISFFMSASARPLFVHLLSKFDVPYYAFDWGVDLLHNLGVGGLEAALLFGLIDMVWSEREKKAEAENEALVAELRELSTKLDALMPKPLQDVGVQDAD